MDVFCNWFHFNCFFFGVYSRKVVYAYVCFIFSITPTGNILGEFLKVVTQLTLLVLDMILYLCVLVLFTLISIFGVSSTSGITWGRAYGISVFILPNFIFGNLPFSWCNC